MLLVSCAFAVVASAAAADRPARDRAPAKPAARGIAVSRLGTSFSSRQNYNRFDYVIVGVANAAEAGALRPKSLVYMSGTSVQHRFFTGVTVDAARARGWLLKDSSGNYLENAAYEVYLGDVGNPDYQRAWANNVAAFLKRHHNDGVFIDDVIADVGQFTDYKYPVQYPDQQAWQDAEVSFVSYVGQALKKKGFYVLVSANGRVRGDQRSVNAELTRRFWNQLAPYVNGLFCEYWLQLPTDVGTLRVTGSNSWKKWWGPWQGLIDVAQSAGVDFFAEMYGSPDNTNVMRYGRASFLLDWNGEGGAFIYQPDGSSTNPWNREWTMAVGQPAGKKRKVGVGWRRDFTAGVVLVNPSESTQQTFSLGRTYYQPDGTAVTSVTLDPATAAILRRAP